MEKRILVTGGNGTVGAGLVKELRERGHWVVSCDRSHREDETGFSLRTDVDKPTYARCDVGEFRQIERVIDTLGPFDHVYHAAAEFGRWNGEDFYESLWRTNAVGTKNIVRLQERLKFRLIHFSSSEVYGDWPDLMVESVMDAHEVKQLNDYAMSKWVNEMQIRNSAAQYKTESVVVRLFNTYGPGEYYSPYRSVNCRFLYCALMGLPWAVFRGHSRTSTYARWQISWTTSSREKPTTLAEIPNIPSKNFRTPFFLSRERTQNSLSIAIQRFSQPGTNAWIRANQFEIWNTETPIASRRGFA